MARQPTRYYIGHRQAAAAFNTLRGRCKRYNREFNLTIEQYESIRKLPCHYCKVQLPKSNAPSLDRINNSKGYTIENVLPCCTECNTKKSNRQTVKETEFLAIVLKIYRRCQSYNQQDRLLNWLYIFQ